MASSPLRAVFLDAGHTILHEEPSRSAIYAECAREYDIDISDEEMGDRMDAAFDAVPQSVEGGYRYSPEWFREFIRCVYAPLGIPRRSIGRLQRILVERFESPGTFQLYPEVPELLDELKKRDLIVGIISNWSERLSVLCNGLKIGNYFDFIVTSAEIHSEKPSRAIFERALFRAGVTAEEALHIGDNPDKDMRGAIGAGLRTALLQRGGEAGTTEHGIPVLTNLLEALPIVDALLPAASDQAAANG